MKYLIYDVNQWLLDFSGFFVLLDARARVSSLAQPAAPSLSRIAHGVRCRVHLLLIESSSRWFSLFMAFLEPGCDVPLGSPEVDINQEISTGLKSKYRTVLCL